MNKLHLLTFATFALAGTAFAGGGQPQPMPAAQPTTAPTTSVIEVEDIEPESSETKIASAKVVMPEAAPLTALTVPLYNAEGLQSGTAHFTQGDEGVQVQLNASGLSAGKHGFHIHAVGSCENTVEDGKTKVFGAAGGHFDPTNTNNHAGPDTSSFLGHAGDMPNVMADADGNVMAEFTTHKFNLRGLFGIHGKSVILHKMGDNYHTDPAGDAGSRALCGIIK